MTCLQRLWQWWVRPVCKPLMKDALRDLGYRYSQEWKSNVLQMTARPDTPDAIALAGGTTKSGIAVRWFPMMSSVQWRRHYVAAEVALYRHIIEKVFYDGCSHSIRAETA